MARQDDIRARGMALAKGLGWFSLGLGAVEMLAPGAINRALGLGDHPTLVRGFGLREAAAGVGILTQEDPTLWIWGRVAGDALDLAAIAPGLRQDNPHRPAAALAFAAVGAVTLLDLVCARAFHEAPPSGSREPAHDYSGRSGFPRPAAEMRGTAAGAMARTPVEPGDAELLAASAMPT